MYRSSQSGSSSGALPSSKKTHSEKHKQILKQLLKEDGNRVCVDCKTSAHPRWASWNLGCFICIRCSGIHRSMGTHISKVKSVDLDAWTDEQVESMVKWGNDKCNGYWEAKLPDGYVPDASKIENFIRTKYDLKKWVESSKIPDPMTIKNSKTAAAPKSQSHDLLSSGRSRPAVQAAQPVQPTQHSGNLLDDDFGSFTSAPVKPNTAPPPIKANSTPSSVKSSPAVVSGNNNPLPNLPIKTSSQSSMSGRPDLKKSILSLYSSPSSSNSSFIQPPQPPPPPQQQPQQKYQGSDSSLTNSLQGLSFNTASPSYPTSNSSRSTINSTTNSTTNTIPANNRGTWNNEWSDVTSDNTWTSNNNVKSTGLDDDLFKNVWN